MFSSRVAKKGFLQLILQLKASIKERNDISSFDNLVMVLTGKYEMLDKRIYHLTEIKDDIFTSNN